MKKIILLSAYFSMLSCLIFSYELSGFPREYDYAFDSMSNKNWLFFTATELERRGVRVVIINDETRVKDIKNSIEYSSSEWLAANSGGRETVLIMLRKKQGAAHIALTEGLTAKLGRDFAARTEDSILKPTLWRWYIPVNRSIAKALAAVIFELDKGSSGIDVNGFGMLVKPGGFWYGISTVFPGREITSLFFLEPISFMIYFPMVTFFVIVNLFGRVNGLTAFRIMRWVWAGFMLLTAAMIWGRINAVYPEFIFMFKIFVGATVPIYVYILLMYDRELYMAAYSYLTEITGGGFNENNVFEGKPWQADSGRGINDNNFNNSRLRP